jgi:hypothetical protein
MVYSSPQTTEVVGGELGGADNMPRVRMEFDLPREQKEFEDCVLGRDSIRTLQEFRAWLREKLERAKRDDRGRLLEYGRALEDANKQLKRILEAAEFEVEMGGPTDDDDGEEG